MGNRIETVILVLVVLVNHSNSIDVISHSDDQFVREGQSHFVYCSTNEPYERCWFKKDTKKLCHTIDSDEIGQLNGTICSNHDNITMILDSTLCGVRIDNVAAADQGIYKCFVWKENSITGCRNITVDVAIPAKVISYQGIRKIGSPPSSSHENTMNLRCIESEGHPKPTISASLENINFENGQALDSIPLNTSSTNGNTSSYNINITPELCKYHLKCHSLQIEETSGNVLYESYKASNQPLCNVFTFSSSDGSVTVEIPFNTTSNVFQAVWNIKTIIENNVRIRSGSNYRKDDFVARKIKNTSEGKSASLVIKNISLIELNRLHYLNINSGQSVKNSLQYGFFVLEKGPEADTLVNENNNDDNHYNPSTGNDSTGMIFFVTGFVILFIGIVALLLLRRI